MYLWDRLIGSIASRRATAAAAVGLSFVDLMGIGRAAAFDAEQSWSPDGGRSMSSWVAVNVEWRVLKMMEVEYKAFAEQLQEEEAGEEFDIDEVLIVRQALDHLQAKLPQDDWTVLWLAYAEGYQGPEIASVFGISAMAARKKLQRARERAVTLLDPLGIAGAGAGI